MGVLTGYEGDKVPPCVYVIAYPSLKRFEVGLEREVEVEILNGEEKTHGRDFSAMHAWQTYNVN